MRETSSGRAAASIEPDKTPALTRRAALRGGHKSGVAPYGLCAAGPDEDHRWDPGTNGRAAAGPPASPAALVGWSGFAETELQIEYWILQIANRGDRFTGPMPTTGREAW